MEKHYTAIITFTAQPEQLHTIIADVNKCVQNTAESATEITIIAQED